MAGLALLGAAFGVLVDRLSSPELINFFRGRKHDERLLKKLKLKLLGLNTVLNDAEDKQFTDRTVKEWLDELKDAIYHAEDLVDEIATEALRCKVEAEYQSGPNQVQSLISSFTKLFDDEIESKLERMIDVLEDFTKEKDVLGLSTKVDGRSWSHTRLPTSSLVDESIVLGRENDKEKIIKLLLSDGESSHHKVEVIPIVGMGGVGKTTLAQLLYNDDRLHGHFVTKAWVCVSDVFDVESVTRTIVEAVNGRSSNARDLNSLQVKLKELLSEKKFLIVLDDVWNENYENWNSLMAPLRSGAHGSRIIVTTRNISVASIMRTVPIHALKELQEKECQKLFFRLAFENGDCNAHPNLEIIGNDIVRKCNGLPLAVKTLGGLLRSERDVKDWKNILESPIWELPVEKSNILPALRLSYYYLPSHLKRCFAYCSIFFKDYQFKMEELISIWIAEGIFKDKKNKTMEEEGYECFNELLSRSFFQRSNANDPLYVMHDLVHDVAQYVMGDFCYRLKDCNSQCIAGKVRYFSFVRTSFCSFEEFKEIREAKSLRTFLPCKREGFFTRKRSGGYSNDLSKKLVDEFLPRLACLRLLSLSHHGITKLPYSIGDLIHLRFLDLSCTEISELPESVCTLYNLETLLLFGCYLLTTLPANLFKLISLRHLDLSRTSLKEMPMNISKLENLQQLTVFIVGKYTTINDLGAFRSLRGTISISGLQNVKSGNCALEAKMSEKEHLEKLALEWDGTTEDSQNARDVFEKLKPHTNLKHLEIRNYGGTRFPTWLGDNSFCNMVSLCLENCENCFQLPPLGQMPSLKELIIERMPGIMNVGPEFYGESGSLRKPFQSLVTLRFEGLSEWVNWYTIDAGEFSRLQRLEVINCPKLIGPLPTKVSSLAGLEITDCPNLVASLSGSTSIRKLVLNDGQGVEMEWQGVSSVEELEISGFESLKEFPGEMVKNLKELMVEMECPRLYEELPEEMSHWCTSFERLKLISCERLKSIPLGLFPKLRSLEIEDCEKFETLLIPDGIELLNLRTLEISLERLEVSSCERLKSIPLGLFPKLRSLEIEDCEKFETLLIPDGIELLNLTSLSIDDCDNFLSFPSGGLPASNLSELSVSGCKKLKALPEQMNTLLPSLQSLFLRDCPEIESFPEGGLPSRLTRVHIEKCKKLVGGRRDWGLPVNLKTFIFAGESEDVLESFPEEGLLPSTLTFLHFRDLPNLKSLDIKGLQLLGSLGSMVIINCPQLPSLPEEGLPTSLFWLCIDRCPLLKPRCRREEGEDWHKIAHIPHITIDGEGINE